MVHAVHVDLGIQNLNATVLVNAILDAVTVTLVAIQIVI
jgi:hypothetical protein